MRTFNVSVNNGEVVCRPEKMHVPPNIHEDIAVCLDSQWAADYKLKVILAGGASIKKHRLNSSTVILHDHNTTPLIEKFNIELDPLGNANQVTPLDPQIVNE